MFINLSLMIDVDVLIWLQENLRPEHGMVTFPMVEALGEGSDGEGSVRAYTYRDPRDPRDPSRDPKHLARHRLLYDPLHGTVAKHTKLTEKDLEVGTDVGSSAHSKRKQEKGSPSVSTDKLGNMPLTLLTSCSSLSDSSRLSVHCNDRPTDSSYIAFNSEIRPTLTYSNPSFLDLATSPQSKMEAPIT